MTLKLFEFRTSNLKKLNGNVLFIIKQKGVMVNVEMNENREINSENLKWTT